MDLKSMHPLLPDSTATEYGHRAAVGLERHQHVPGVSLLALLRGDDCDASLHWLRPPAGDAEQLDTKKVTEDTAEAVALALVHAGCGWVVRRRLQQGESADWLLRDPEAGLVALEVSGTEKGVEFERRLRDKLEQVQRATIGDQRVACVVELATPRAKVVVAWRKEA